MHKHTHCHCHCHCRYGIAIFNVNLFILKITENIVKILNYKNLIIKKSGKKSTV